MELLLPLVTPARRAALGGAVDCRWVLGGGATRIQIAGDQNAPKGFGRPLLPIKKMNKANPRAPSMPWYLGGQSDLAWAQVPLPLFAGRLG